MRKKSFIGSCVSNPFGCKNQLMDITDEAKEITKETFLKKCIVFPKIKLQMNQYPNDYEYYSWRNGRIYFFKHSAIEYFYK
jgi:hypothetical protein